MTGRAGAAHNAADGVSRARRLETYACSHGNSGGVKVCSTGAGDGRVEIRVRALRRASGSAA